MSFPLKRQKLPFRKKILPLTSGRVKTFLKSTFFIKTNSQKYKIEIFLINCMICYSACFIGFKYVESSLN